MKGIKTSCTYSSGTGLEKKCMGFCRYSFPIQLIEHCIHKKTLLIKSNIVVNMMNQYKPNNVQELYVVNCLLNTPHMKEFYPSSFLLSSIIGISSCLFIFTGNLFLPFFSVPYFPTAKIMVL